MNWITGFSSDEAWNFHRIFTSVFERRSRIWTQRACLRVIATKLSLNCKAEFPLGLDHESAIDWKITCQESVEWPIHGASYLGDDRLPPVESRRATSHSRTWTELLNRPYEYGHQPRSQVKDTNLDSYILFNLRVFDVALHAPLPSRYWRLDQPRIGRDVASPFEVVSADRSQRRVGGLEGDVLESVPWTRNLQSLPREFFPEAFDIEFEEVQRNSGVFCMTCWNPTGRLLIYLPLLT